MGHDDGGHGGGKPQGLATNFPSEVELQELHTMQAEVLSIESKLWNSENLTAEEEEELEQRRNLLKIKMTQQSTIAQEAGMTTGLQRIAEFANITKWHEAPPEDERKVLMQLMPVAVLFMALVIGASTIHFSDHKPMPGELFAVTSEDPLLWPLKRNSYLVDVDISIPSIQSPGSPSSHRRSCTGSSVGAGGRRSQLSAQVRGGGLLRKGGEAFKNWLGAGRVVRPDDKGVALTGAKAARRSMNSTSGEHAATMDGEEDPVVTLWLIDMPLPASTLPNGGVVALNLSGAEMVERFMIGEEGAFHLLEVFVSKQMAAPYLVITTDSSDPLPLAIAVHALGWLGPAQVVIAGLIMVFLFGLIMTEVLHRTMAAMIGAALVLIVLAMESRVPTLSTVVGWMDHGTLGLLWGMMLIVGVTMRTGVFEWTGVMACKLSGGDKTKLGLLLCAFTAILSAFLDNVTTILLISPVTCKLCKLVHIDPRPYLISEAIFSNLGGTATMIGDPPNIIIGNLLAKHLDFNDFLFNLGPGVIICSPAVFYFLLWYFGDGMKGQLKVDIVKLQKMYPITNMGLLIKCGVVLACVIFSFFLHPVTHLDPAWISIMGAVWLLVAFDMHHCHEALMGVEWDTLLFFAALFVVVEGVGELGLLRFIANTLSSMVGSAPIESRQPIAILLILWASAFFSACVDNIPFTATMVPVMMQLVDKVPGISIEPLAWALAFGACLGGNGTLIGASANIVMASKAEVEGFRITFVQFLKVGWPTMTLTICIITVYLMILNAAFWQAHAGSD